MDSYTDTIFGWFDLEQFAGMSRSTINKFIRTKRFPPFELSMKNNKKCNVWSKKEVTNWLETNPELVKHVRVLRKQMIDRRMTASRRP